MASLNDIFSWFQTGDLPTEAQFRATFSSFYHKDEKIPVANVQGLTELFQNTATTGQLAAKADRDATNLQAADVDAWKTKLGVGNLPPNIATYDPAKANYVMMKDGTDRPAGDLGKNVANASLTSVRGAGLVLGDNWSLSTRGYSLYFEGLPDKSNDATYNKMLVQDSTGKMAMSDGRPVLESVMGGMATNKDANGNYDLSYNEYLVYNPATKKLAKSDRPQIVTTNNFPSQITVNYNSTIANSNYVPNPSTPADIADTYAIVNTIESGRQFTKFTASEIKQLNLSSSKFPASLQSSGYQLPMFFNKLDGQINRNFYVDIPAAFNEPVYVANMDADNGVIACLFDKEMPSDKDWIIKFRTFSGDFFGCYKTVIGMVANNTDAPLKYINAEDFQRFWHGAVDAWLMRGAQPYYQHMVGSQYGINYYFIKKGSKLSLYQYNEVNGTTALTVTDYDPAKHKFFRFLIPLTFYGFYGFTVKDISYWIQP